MFRRNGWALVLIGLFSLLFAGAALAEGAPGGQVLFAADGDALWRWEEQQLFCRACADGEEAPAASMGGVRLLAASGGNAYCLMGQGNRQHVREVSPEGETMAIYPVDAALNPRQLSADADALYLLADDGTAAASDDEAYAGTMLWRLDRQAAEGAQWQPLTAEGWENGNVYCFCVADGLLAVSDGRGMLSTIDLRAGRLTASVRGARPEAIRLVVPEDGNPCAFCQSDTRITWVDLTTGAQEELARVQWEGDEPDSAYARLLWTLPEECAGLELTSDALITRNARTGELMTFPLADWREPDWAHRLTLTGCWLDQYPGFEQAVRLFHERYPDVEVAVRQGESIDLVEDWLRRGVPGCDVFFGNLGLMTSEAALAEAGVLADLSACPEIAEQMGDYLDGFGAFRTGEKLYAIPFEFSPTLWRMNEQLAETLEIEAPGWDWTWDDLFEMAEKVRAYNETAAQPVALVNDEGGFRPYLLDLYNVNSVDPLKGMDARDDARFASLVERWTQLCRDGLVREDYEELSPNALFTVNYDVAYMSMGDRPYLTPPGFGEDTRYQMRVERAVVNGNSAHAEEAMYFLACLMRPEAAKATPLEIFGPMRKDVEGYAPLEWEIQPVSEANAALWRHMIERSAVRAAWGPSMDELLSWKERLLAGEATAEEFAAYYRQNVAEAMTPLSD